MLNERQQQILNLLEVKGELQLNGLRDIFPELSMMTLRRDLSSLESAGHLIRTHGGAVSVKKLSSSNGEEDAYSLRATENIEVKMKIALKALTFVEKGRSIYFDSGSTIMYLAKALPDDNYSIITSGVNIAFELVKKQKPSIVTVGGTINRNTLSISGPNAISLIDTVNIDLAFMAASGFSPDTGFTVSNIYECELKRKVIQRAKKVIVLMDSSKINKTLAFTFANLEDLDALVCDEGLTQEIIDLAEANSVKLM
jgi:DeoR/GlpR family transcriptional regulator of sugar metabolism